MNVKFTYKAREIHLDNISLQPQTRNFFPVAHSLIIRSQWNNHDLTRHSQHT